jgi:BlaI family transcriptional regulator, penicillinase repressor
MNAEHSLTRRERQIMDLLHAQGRATVAEVLGALPDPPSYSAVRALLRILEDKGHVKHRLEATRFVYEPVRSRQQARRSALRRLVETFFQGSAAGATAALLESSASEMSEDELRNLKRLIDQARREGR